MLMDPSSLTPNEFMRMLEAGEFDGRLHDVLSELSTEQLQAIVSLSDRFERRFRIEALKSTVQRVASWR